MKINDQIPVFHWQSTSYSKESARYIIQCIVLSGFIEQPIDIPVDVEYNKNECVSLSLYRLKTYLELRLLKQRTINSHL